MTTRGINSALLFALGLAATGSPAAVSPESATLRFLEQRVQSDPLDSVAQNRRARHRWRRATRAGQLRRSRKNLRETRRRRNHAASAGAPGAAGGIERR